MTAPSKPEHIDIVVYREWTDPTKRKRKKKKRRSCKDRGKYIDMTELRSWRDKVLLTNNVGRLNHLLFKFPFSVVRVSTESGGLQPTRVEVELRSGWTFVDRDSSARDAVKKVANKLYKFARDDIRGRKVK